MSDYVVGKIEFGPPGSGPKIPKSRNTIELIEKGCMACRCVVHLKPGEPEVCPACKTPLVSTEEANRMIIAEYWQTKKAPNA